MSHGNASSASEKSLFERTRKAQMKVLGMAVAAMRERGRLRQQQAKEGEDASAGGGGGAAAAAAAAAAGDDSRPAPSNTAFITGVEDTSSLFATGAGGGLGADGADLVDDAEGGAKILALSRAAAASVAAWGRDAAVSSREDGADLDGVYSSGGRFANDEADETTMGTGEEGMLLEAAAEGDGDSDYEYDEEEREERARELRRQQQESLEKERKEEEEREREEREEREKEERERERRLKAAGAFVRVSVCLCVCVSVCVCVCLCVCVPACLPACRLFSFALKSNRSKQRNHQTAKPSNRRCQASASAPMTTKTGMSTHTLRRSEPSRVRRRAAAAAAAAAASAKEEKARL